MRTHGVVVTTPAFYNGLRHFKRLEDFGGEQFVK